MRCSLLLVALLLANACSSAAEPIAAAENAAPSAAAGLGEPVDQQFHDGDHRGTVYSETRELTETERRELYEAIEAVLTDSQVATLPVFVKLNDGSPIVAVGVDVEPADVPAVESLVTQAIVAEHTDVAWLVEDWATAVVVVAGDAGFSHHAPSLPE